ncbi:uncharacterized protein LDX57_010129 [Aspergillus melleus]|uniref:uncharacterized protein n=1 Tax=Aspergillus melleus TaxID=138277 RepID=UPI001E8DE2A2|nr:uncharacterized protein LDX57_010129 [Aspergillus melleus]KAH8432493.1 hypothetical protein LDX57_010129 [Aspergillus melleus]
MPYGAKHFNFTVADEITSTNLEKEFVFTNRTVAQPAKTVLQHIIYWVDQSFSYPKSSSNYLKTWDLVAELERYVFKRHDQAHQVADITAHIREFMSKICNYMSKKPLWRDPIVMGKQV